jgi:hypothetical protein
MRIVYEAFQHDGTGGQASNGIYETYDAAMTAHDQRMGEPRSIPVFTDKNDYDAYRVDERRRRALSKLTPDERKLLGL